MLFKCKSCAKENINFLNCAFKEFEFNFNGEKQIRWRRIPVDLARQGKLLWEISEILGFYGF